MASDRILDLLRRPVDPDEVAEIRELWKVHSIAEDNRDLPGLISTLTEDCVYTVAGTGARWEGHEGATRFYTELLTAFPDIHFDLDYIVIGPQGVCEEAIVTATHEARWLDHEPTGERLEWRNAIFFPWDPGRPQVQGRDGLHRPRASTAARADLGGLGPQRRADRLDAPATIGRRGSRRRVPRDVGLGSHRPAGDRRRRSSAAAATGC